jgi:hypothetical protein
VQIVKISDLKDPDDPLGRTYREVNNSKGHVFKVGELVELDSGVRLFVSKLTRDCDGTPLYSLSTGQENKFLHGFDEKSLKRCLTKRAADFTICECGSKDFRNIDGNRLCAYCRKTPKPLTQAVGHKDLFTGMSNKSHQD